MKLKFIDIDSFCENLPEIETPKLFESGKFAAKGLFSQQMFGPVKSYNCACSRTTYKGRFSSEEKCPKCEVEIISNETRRMRYGKITLPFPVFNPTIFYIITNAKPQFKTILNDVLTYTHTYYFDDTGKPLRAPEGMEWEDPDLKLQGLNGAIKIVEKLIETIDRPEFQFIRDNFDKITVQNVIVIPPDFRPCGNSNSGVKVVDEINSLYSNLVVRSNQMKAVPFNIREFDDIHRTNFKHIQTTVIKIFDFVLSKMAKKKGLIRSNILGKRLDFSGRAVISPDPTLTVDRCRVPYWMVLEILKPQFVSYLVSRRVCKRYNEAVKLIEDCIKTKDTKLFTVAEEFCEGKVCILNRQPTLHRLGVLGFNLSIHLGNTIQLHPMICHPYNADFDGDAMAIYVPITKRSEEDIRKKLGIWNNLISQTDVSIVPRPNQDIILGIYTATADNDTSEIRETKDGTKMPFGRYLFNECLPEDYPVIKSSLVKGQLFNILNDIALKYPPKEVMETLDKIKNLGFSMSTLKGYTLSIDDLHSQKLVDIANSLEGDAIKDLTKMKSPEVMKVLRSFPFATYIESGARGDWDQAKQLVLSRAYVSDSTGKIRPNLIRSSLVQGLNQDEFFNSCWGARKGLLDTALSTGDSGYLTRQLIYSTVFVELSEKDDCGTTDTMQLEVTTKELAKTILWRYYLDDNDNLVKITNKNIDSIVGTTIRLRSPIYCTDKKICKKCYGDLYKILHSDQIGIVATQAVGERTTQLVLRTFHLSGVAQINDDSGDQHDIISGIDIANKLFHKPTSLGKINEPIDLVKMIYEVFNAYKSIHMIHYEVIVSAMMWSGDSLWRLKDDRDKAPKEWVSILQVPSRHSWLLGAAFSNLKTKILEGLVHSRTDTETSLSKLFRL
ncbi:MAG: hypothetical protein KAS32_08910 [Candidatus Peribacteraceae bacterium]|nr:hypothetical protein [Candidatus Peribacteraceae bacterium]